MQTYIIYWTIRIIITSHTFVITVGKYKFANSLFVLLVPLFELGDIIYLRTRRVQIMGQVTRID